MRRKDTQLSSRFGYVLTLPVCVWGGGGGEWVLMDSMPHSRPAVVLYLFGPCFERSHSHCERGLNVCLCARRSAGRGTGVISVAGARPVVPASYVPEDLVAQAQTVLQGKSRNLIIRELQVGGDGWWWRRP